MKTNLLALFVWILFGPVTPAATLVVTNVADSGAGTLRQAVADASAGDNIIFSSTLSSQVIFITNGSIAITKNITIDGTALSGQIRLDGGQTNSIFTIGASKFSSCTVILNSLIITNGFSASYGGGGINVNQSSVLTMNNCAIVNNTAPVGGGGILNSGVLTMNGCAVANNFATAGSSGGGIFMLGITSLTDSTVANNSSYDGGGILCYAGLGALTLNNSTVANNTATHRGGGILNMGSVLKLTNTIVSMNNNSDIVGGMGAGVGNMISASNINLAPLGNYGGPTPTMPPLFGSPAIDAGVDTVTNSYIYDQRGYPRLSGTHVDVGAVEVFAATNSPKLTGLEQLETGFFQLNFTNVSGASFSVWISTNVALPFNQWSNIGYPTEIASGYYQFVDQQAASNMQSFYRVSSP